MAARRRGFHLTEVLIALAVATGPMLVAIHLIQSNARGARFNRDRAVSRMVLLDLASLLKGERPQNMRALLEPGQQSRLNDLLEKRMALMPTEARKIYREQARPVLGRIRGSLVDLGDAAAPGLSKLTLTADLSDRQKVDVEIFFRPAARERLPTQPDAACSGGATPNPAPGTPKTRGGGS